ncbi:hypothetical protein M011DRAFT_406038 [Sporormia fimetaria CBS 119925]|uniref:BZIP domain-containing protein n=1 Tax=Sporormia fimetaria CBS 119925 TaxID=1340428 RepID=A0A6A6V4P1_9PLEO|nr:hypothetical protein M011DRAFT_406038 [Sporormia fimetaria CBS 119925]
MSGFGGRRGVNVSQYIANLNTVQSPEETPFDSPTDFTDDLNFLANNDFVDWEGGFSAPAAAPAPLDFSFDQPTEAANAVTEPKMDFNFETDFTFGDYTGFQNPINDASLQLSQGPQPAAYPVAANSYSPTTSVPPLAAGFGPAGKKRKSSAPLEPPSQHALDEAARHAAEEDKRRRNTAASARFRIKKKQREQALEKTAKEMSDRVSVLETRIQQLETENNWLKNLITGKNGDKVNPELEASLRRHEQEKGLKGEKREVVEEK